MDPKELKTLLKEAKDGLKSKDFATTVKNCKTILKKEPLHYQANLYLGTAMKEQSKWQQAIESYKKAAEIDPNQVYAWQGIILTYEKQGIKNHSDLLDAYKRVATFYEKDDKQKYIESTKKLANVLISQDDKKGALKVITRLSKSVGVDLEVASMIVQLLNGTVWNTRTPEQNELYTSALESIVTESPQPSEDTCKKYFTQVNKAGQYDQVIRQALAMKDRWNFYYSPMEWLCRYYIEERIDLVSQQEIGPMNVLTDKLFKLYPSSTFGHFARGKFLIDEGLKMSDGFMFIRTGLESNYNSFALLNLVGGRIIFGDFEGAVQDCQAGLRNFEKDPEVCKKLKLFMVEALMGLDSAKASEYLEKVRADYKQDQSTMEKLLLLEARVFVHQSDFKSLKDIFTLIDASESIKDHWRVNFYRVLLAIDLSNSSDLITAIDSQVALNMDNLDLLLESSIILFNQKLYEKSGELFLKVTENPNGSARPLPWKYLGMLYSLEENTQLAAKCFRKSYEFIPAADVGSLLSDAYFTLDETQRNMDLLIDATKSFSKAKSKWAWLRLGILHLHEGKANEAVNSFQAAVRSDITDCHVWESMADAYFLRGSYTAALSTYQKALSLGADPMYPKLKIGVVYQCLGQHDESISTLKELLKEYPKNTAILVELARTCSLTAQEMSHDNFDITALRTVENSLVYAVLAIRNSPNRILLPWKIVADSPLILCNSPEETVIKVPDFFLGEPQSEDSGNDELKFQEISMDKFNEIGTKALLECLNVIGSKESIGLYSQGLDAYIYHQLGLLYFNRAQSPTSKSDRKVSADFFNKALVCVKKAVASNQKSHIYWNTLGVICYFMEQDELSQHAFIKSLELETNNVVAWCNLGMLYLKHKSELLAHKAFNKAQSVSPLYSYSWVGQGLCAEIIQPKEAPDLFRHAAHLEPTPFGVSCYADWVCRLLLNKVQFEAADYWFSIIRVDALTIVNDLMSRVEHRCPSAYLYNMKGVTSALNGFYETALESFTKAFELSSIVPIKTSDNAISPEEIKKIVLNRIAVLVKMKRYEEAVEAFSSIENLDSIGFAIGALTMGKLGYAEESEKLYIQLLESLTDEDDKISTTIALGLIYYEAKGAEAACQLLLQKSMVNNPHALLALMAIGIMGNDADFISNVMEPLDELKDNEEWLADIGLMKACVQIMTGNPRKGVNELLKLVRVHPLNSRLWSVLSQIIFNHQSNEISSLTCRKVTLTALKLSSWKRKGSKEESITYKSSAMISLCHLMDNNDWKTAIVNALTGIKKYPEERENWIVLACAFWYQFTESKSPQVYDKVVRLLEKELSLNRIHERAHAWTSAFYQAIQHFRVL